MPTIGILLKGNWKDSEIIRNNFEDFERPSIIVGDSNGLAELIRDYILDQNNFADNEERISYYSEIPRIKADYNIKDLPSPDDLCEFLDFCQVNLCSLV